MANRDEIKAELRRRHDAGQKTGGDRLNLDALELIEHLDIIELVLWKALALLKDQPYKTNKDEIIELLKAWEPLRIVLAKYYYDVGDKPSIVKKAIDVFEANLALLKERNE